MTSALAEYAITGTHECFDNLRSGEERRLHIATLRTLCLADGFRDLGSGSKYNKMASLRLETASIWVFPWLQHPFKEGQ